MIDSLTYQQLSDLKKGALFARLAHEAISEVAAVKTSFSQEETNILVEHSNDPDYQDWFFDRFWKHFYDVGSGFFGGAPESGEIQYMQAVNGNDLALLSHASHYLMDVGCLFHTTFTQQNYHTWYEQWVDDNLEEILSLIDINTIEPVIIDDVSDAIIDLATITNMRHDRLISYIVSEDFDSLKVETASNLRDVTSYVYGFYIKFLYDVENNVYYEIPYQSGLNTILTISLVVGLVYYFYKKKKD